jgi:hypothetical protein
MLPPGNSGSPVMLTLSSAGNKLNFDAARSATTGSAFAVPATVAKASVRSAMRFIVTLLWVAPRRDPLPSHPFERIRAGARLRCTVA